MKCARCEASIIEGEGREHLGRALCEDCYMDTLSPAKTCDPWAVHSAKSFGRELGGVFELTECQRRILETLKETGGAVLTCSAGIIATYHSERHIKP